LKAASTAQWIQETANPVATSPGTFERVYEFEETGKLNAVHNLYYAKLTAWDGKCGISKTMSYERARLHETSITKSKIV
jgi:hypothetical protein